MEGQSRTMLVTAKTERDRKPLRVLSTGETGYNLCYQRDSDCFVESEDY